ncbi:MAG TPA: hypothetical protein VIJ75_00655 [Hanamia sp.]
MEFNEMKKLWDSQNNEPLYAINEKALHNRILSKKKTGYHITNTSELLLIIVNAGAGLLVLGINISTPGVNIFLYLGGAWMLLSALFILVSRIRRIKSSHQFDRSILGDLSQAISLAAYQVRLSQVGRWNILPIGVFSLLALWESGKPAWSIVIIAIIFAFGARVTVWEHSIYKNRKIELETLQKKLQRED